MIKVTIKNQVEFDLVKSIVKDDFYITKMFYQDEEHLFPVTINFQYSEDFPSPKSTESSRLARMQDTIETQLSKLIEVGIQANYIDVSKLTYNLNTGKYQE